MPQLQIKTSGTFDGVTPLPAGSFVKQSSGLYLAEVGNVGIVTPAQLGAPYGGCFHAQWIATGGATIGQEHDGSLYNLTAGPTADFVCFPTDQIILTDPLADSLIFAVSSFANEAELKEFYRARQVALDGCCAEGVLPAGGFQAITETQEGTTNAAFTATAFDVTQFCTEGVYQINWSAEIFLASSGAGAGAIGEFRVDGTQKNEFSNLTTDEDTRAGLVVLFLSAGNHTFDFRIKSATGTEETLIQRMRMTGFKIV